MPYVLLCWPVKYAFLYHYAHFYTIKGEAMTDICGILRKRNLVNQSTTEATMMKAVSETSRPNWWEWAIVGVLFVMAIVCARV